MNMRFAKDSDLYEVISANKQLRHLSVDRIRNKISQNEIIIAVSEERIVGEIGIEYIWTTRPYIDTLFVDPKFRRQKVATQLLQFVEDYLRSQGFQFFYSSAEEKATVSINWHEKNGFIKCGTLDKLNLPDKAKEFFFCKKL